MICLATSFSPQVCQAATGTDEAQLLLSEARTRITEGRFPEAVKLYRRVTSLLPSEPNVRKEFARLLASHLETRGEAEKVYAEIAEILPQDVNLALERAGNLAVMGDHVNASIEYRRAFELKPDDDIALVGYLKQVTRLGSSEVAITRVSNKLAESPEDLASRLILAELFRCNGRYDDALDQFSLIQQSHPNDLIALRGTAEAWLSLGFYGRASEAFQKADVNSSRSRSLSDQARVLLLSGQPEAALKILITNAKDVGREPSALVVLADTYRLMNQHALERVTLETLVKLSSTSVDSSTLERLARVRFEMGEKETSIESCRQLLTFDPQSAIGAFGLMLNGDPSALQARENSTLSPTRRAAKEQADAEAAIFWNLHEKAIATLNKSGVALEGFPRLLLELGRSQLQRRDSVEALKTFARIAISNGKWLEALSGMADAERLRGNNQRALAFYSEVLEDDPSNFRALSGKADALLQMKQLESAAVVLNDLHKSSPESSFVRERLQKTLSSLDRAFKVEKKLTDPSPAKTDSTIALNEYFRSDVVSPTLKIGDSIRITAVGRPGVSLETRLADDGKITLPFLSDPIHAACKTEQELGALISTNGGVKLAGITISVAITNFHQASLLVSGAMYLPGRFNIRKPIGLLPALMLASGANQRAGRIVYVVRQDNACAPKPKGESIDIVEAYERSEVENGRVTLNRPLQAGDAVIIPEKDSAFILGEVSHPGAITLSNRLRLLEALARSGGLLAGARKDYLKITRLMPAGIAPQKFIINLDEIEQQRTGDVVLLPGDIVEITSRTERTSNSLASTATITNPGNNNPVVMKKSATPDKPAVVTNSTPEVKPATTAPTKRVMSGAVLSGKALDLPLPLYPEIARRRRADGMVIVEVIIDINGKVTSAKALSGDSALQTAAVQAALRARFTPTTLSGEPVKVSGIIKYNFALSQ